MQAGLHGCRERWCQTSDDEDLFFVSQSSDRYGYTSNDDLLRDERLARVAAAQPPTPPQRQLEPKRRSAQSLHDGSHALPTGSDSQRLARCRSEPKRMASSRAQTTCRRGCSARREVKALKLGRVAESMLVPSSGPSSQADHEDPSAPPSPSVPRCPKSLLRFRHSTKLLGLGECSFTVTERKIARAGRDVGQASKNAALLPNRRRQKPRKALHTKVTRTIARNDDTNKAVRPHDSGVLRIDEDDAAPIPAHTRRKPTLRDTSPTDSEANIAAGGRKRQPTRVSL